MTARRKQEAVLRVLRGEPLEVVARELRVMRENRLSAGTGRATPRGPQAHDGTIIPEMVDAMWDEQAHATGPRAPANEMTAALSTGHGQVAVFVAVDHCSAECVGIHAALHGTRHEAPEPIRQGVRARFGAIGRGIASGLSIRHDHASQYMAHDFQGEIAWPGAFGSALGPMAGRPSPSPAVVRAPEGNGCAEHFIRSLKENLLWLRRFHTVEELRLALLAFKETYNEHWPIERHGYRSPAQFRRGQMDNQAMVA